MQNVTCAQTTVQKPSGTPAATNSVSSEEPSTTSGVAIGSTTNPSTAPAPRSRYRAIANAISVPSTVAIPVTTRAISALRATAAHIPAGAHGSAQLSTVNRWRSYERRLDGRLNDNATTIATGTSR
jgi:hypothetical protein